MKKRVPALRSVKIILSASSVLFVILMLMNIYALAQPQKGSLTREDGQRGVQVAITYLNPLKGLGNKELVFDVSMNTHTVDLDVYDFAEILVLRDDDGNLYKALGTEELKGSGHHRGGKVRFPGVDADGNSIINGGKYFEVLVEGVAGVPQRVLRWELPVK